MHEKPGNNAYINLVGGMILRTGLIQKMRRAKRNLFFHAPGGYGKTVAARQWIASVRGKTADMILGEADNDAGVLYRRLARRLASLTGTRRTAPDTALSLSDFLEIIRSLPTKHSRCHLFVDDLHVLKNEDVLSSLPLLASRLPEYVRLCLASRSEPGVALLATGLFTVLGADDFRFTPEEVEWLGAEKERDLSAEQIRSLLARTGGWAMYLSAILSGGEQDATFQPLARYLETQVWEALDPVLQTCLPQLAVPTEITAELAERLTGRTDGALFLERLVKKENVFLYPVDTPAWRFHDIFREFLLERLPRVLPPEELRRLNDVTAEWHYEQGDLYMATRYFFQNRDHAGINRCMRASNYYDATAGSMSVETSLSFNQQYLLNLTPDFIAENPYLTSEYAFTRYLDGDASEFLRGNDMLYAMLPEIAENHPDVVETVGFMGALDFREPLREYVRKVAEEMLGTMPEKEDGEEAHTNTLTMNLPFYHRSQRDYSEYFELNEEDLRIYREGIGRMIGPDWRVMEQALIAGIQYERGELLPAARHALNGHAFIQGTTHPEAAFCAKMILGVTLEAMGALAEADAFMKETETWLEAKAPCLRPNFKALGRALRSGDPEAAREWLTVYANRSGRLPFYQMHRHLATIRACTALGEYAEAAAFGRRVRALAAEYRRPLDVIESGILTAVALWRDDKTKEAVKELALAASIAKPYGFTQAFVNEGEALLPMLWEWKNRRSSGFADTLLDAMYRKSAVQASPEVAHKVSAQQKAMLPYLQKGLAYAEIAAATGLGRDTVKSHVRLLYKRLGVHDAKQAVARAKMLGLLE